MNNLLLSLALWLDNNSYNESLIIYNLLKTAADSAPKQENRNVFLAVFPEEKEQKVIAIADQYYDKFKNDLDFKENIENFRNLNEVINFIQSNSVKKINPKQQLLKELAVKYPNFGNEEFKKLEKSNVELENMEWIVKIFTTSLEQDSIEEYISMVELYQKKKDLLDMDLNSFPALSELRSYLERKFGEDPEIYLKKIEKHALNSKNTDYIYESDNFIVVLSGTKESSQYWGKGTTWCTAIINSEELAENMFSNYSSNGIYLYYILTKESSKFFKRQEPKRKISIGYSKKDGMPIFLTKEHTTVDVNNHELTKEQILDYLGPEGSNIINAIESDIINRKDTKFNEMLSNITPEEYADKISKLGEYEAKDFEKSIASNKNANPIILKNIADKIINQMAEARRNKKNFFTSYTCLDRLITNPKLPNGYFEKLFELADPTDKSYVTSKVKDLEESKLNTVINFLEKTPVDSAGGYITDTLFNVLKFQKNLSNEQLKKITELVNKEGLLLSQTIFQLIKNHSKLTPEIGNILDNEIRGKKGDHVKILSGKYRDMIGKIKDSNSEGAIISIPIFGIWRDTQNIIKYQDLDLKKSGSVFIQFENDLDF